PVFISSHGVLPMTKPKAKADLASLISVRKVAALNPPAEKLAQPSGDHELRRSGCEKLDPAFRKLSFRDHTCVAASSSGPLETPASGLARADPSDSSNPSQTSGLRLAIFSTSQPAARSAANSKVISPLCETDTQE